MPKYHVEFVPRARRELRRLPTPDQRRITDRIKALAANPRPRGSAKIDTGLYRIRIGRYRIIYTIKDDQVLVLILKVARREKDTYSDLGELL